MKRDNYIYGMMAAAALLAASCTDFDDYNKAYTNVSEESTRTLWQNITERKDLTQFAAIAKKAGYDAELNSSRCLTVWAPVDNTYDYQRYLDMDVDSVKMKFMENHIANYAFAITGESKNERVHTLNNKSYLFANGEAGGYTFDGIAMQGNGTPCVNGMLHVISGEVPFYPSLYESIMEKSGTGVDSIVNYYKKYATSELDKTQSIEGPIVDGKQTYLDSVMVENNALFRSLRANISLEDSSFTMALPTDEAYDEAYKAISKLYKYPSKLEWKEVSPLLAGPSPSVSSVTVDADLNDSITRRSIASNLIFSNNNWYNYWLTDKPQTWQRDSLVSSMRNILSNGPEFLYGHKVSEEKNSNGKTIIIDSLAMLPWETYNPEISVPIFSSHYRPYNNTNTSTLSTIFLTDDQIDKSKKGSIVYNEGDTVVIRQYLEFKAASERVSPQVYFYVPDVRATKYNVYVVFVPARYALGSTEAEKLYKVDFSICYADANGKFLSSPKTYSKVTSADSSNVDMVKMCEVEFPVSYYNQNAYPYISIKSSRNFRTESGKYDNTLRIAAILFRPVEYDEYLNSKNQ
ncbi:MAG: fasciclin domain-containing protein [Prevotellaceae bacterium]|nr:fasciclin domain-containing protein [Prevotellaceae bacterium]MDY6200453.1 fasciclin domain-containing protein [Prevotella sp.]